jgi:thiosulfate/3-mercaptopyruvate sulfurtransferase
MPNSYSLPFNVFLQQVKPRDGESTYTRLRPAAEMLEQLKSAIGEDWAQDILDGKRQVIASCGSGMTAGVIWLGLNLLGVRRVALYDEVS